MEMSPEMYARVDISLQGWPVIQQRCRSSFCKKVKKNITKTFFLFRVVAGLPLANQEPPAILIASPPYPTRAVCSPSP